MALPFRWRAVIAAFVACLLTVAFLYFSVRPYEVTIPLSVITGRFERELAAHPDPKIIKTAVEIRERRVHIDVQGADESVTQSVRTAMHAALTGLAKDESQWGARGEYYVDEKGIVVSTRRFETNRFLVIMFVVLLGCTFFGARLHRWR